MGTRPGRRDRHDERDLLERHVGSIAEIHDLSLAQRQAVDDRPDRHLLDEVASWRRRAPAHPLDDLAKTTPDSMLIHRDPIERPEGPRRRIQDVGARPDLEPQPDQGFLNSILGRLIVESGSASEAEEILAVSDIDSLDDLVGMSDEARLEKRRSFVRAAKGGVATVVIHEDRRGRHEQPSAT
jgi:hypothetical protein